MRIMLLAAAAALSLGVGSAYADKERTAPLPSPSAPSEVADNALGSGAKAVIPDSVRPGTRTESPARCARGEGEAAE